MKKSSLLLAPACGRVVLRAARVGDLARCRREARDVTMIYDLSGIPHAYDRTDADAVYAKRPFKEFLFSRDDAEKHGERTYHPGDRK